MAVTTAPGEGNADEAGFRGTASATRVADVLIFLVENNGHGGVSEISRATGIGKTVVYRILQSFLSRDLVVFDADAREYRLGPSAAALGVLAAEHFDQRYLQESALRYLKKLSDASHETATVSSLIGNYCVHIDQVVSTQEIRMHLKTWVPRQLTSGASSKAILAFLPSKRQERILTAAAARVESSCGRRMAELREELEGIYSESVAVSHGERESGSAAVASPVFGSDGMVLGAVSICGPRPRFTKDFIEEQKPHVRQTARLVTQDLSNTKQELA